MLLHPPAYTPTQPPIHPHLSTTHPCTTSMLLAVSKADAPCIYVLPQLHRHAEQIPLPVRRLTRIAVSGYCKLLFRPSFLHNLDSLLCIHCEPHPNFVFLTGLSLSVQPCHCSRIELPCNIRLPPEPRDQIDCPYV